MYWKGIFILGASIAIQINCQYLSLLKIFDMRNPVIVGNNDDLKSNNMFSLMKNVMRQNQSICLMSNFRDDAIQQSPGKVENIWKGSLVLISSPSLSVKIQIVGGKVYFAG